jgi:hypothetical protein
LAVNRQRFWAAVASSLDGKAPLQAAPFGASEHLIASIVNILKPEYVGERWRILDNDESWSDYATLYRPDHPLPVDLLLRWLSGELRYLGGGVRNARALLEALDVDASEATLIPHGRLLSRLLEPPKQPGLETFPAELALLDRQKAPEFLATLTRAAESYERADERRITAICARAWLDVSPDVDLDRTMFGFLAQLIGIYEVLIANECEVLIASTF